MKENSKRKIAITAKKPRKASQKKHIREQTDLKGAIIEGIQDKKGEDIHIIDFRKQNNSICDYFVICHGNSSRQVETIADGIKERVRKETGVKAAHSEGYENAQWILLDYIDIVVHIFQEETRRFYQLEDLWADAKTEVIKNK